MTQMLRLLLALSIALPLLAQTGQIAGRVVDPSGSPVPGVQIRIRNIANGAERRVATAEAGLYLLPLLPPGSYDVSATVTGFKSAQRSGVELAVDQKATVDFTLEVGTVTERVEVTAAAAQLNTVEASQGQVIDNKRVVELPINGRYYGDLALLSAGTVQSAPGSRYNSFSSGGQRVTQNSYLLDGIDNNSVELAGAGRRPEMVQPSIDAVQEFKVQTNAYAAEFGRAMGAIINLTLKSGTNALHGTAFEFLRNEKLDAKNYFTPATAAKPPFKRNQYGFSIGGPVIIPKLYNGKNKTFFFADYEGTRIRETGTIISTLPTARMRSGDFGELTRRLNDPSTGQPFPNNAIPASRLDPVAANLIRLYPNPQSAALANNFTNLAPRWQDVDKWDVRIDQTAGSNDTFFWRLSKQDQFVPDTPNLPAPAYGGGNLDFITEGYNTGAGWNHVFTPSLIATIRAGWNFTLFKRDNPASTNGELLNRKYGIRSGADDIPGAFSQLSITGYRALGIGGFNPVDRDSQNRQISGDLTWVRGRHNLKFGTGLLKSQNNLLSARNAVGNFTFNSQYTSDGAADFLLGLAQAWSYDTPFNVQLRTYNLSLFAQDDWRITNKLTLNFGLRYELSPPWVERYNKMGTLDLDTNPNQPRLVYASGNGSRSDRSLINTDTNNFMPRVGLVYQLTPKTVVRSGYGLYYAYMEFFGDSEHLVGNPPFAYGVSLAGSPTAPAFLFRNGPPAGATDFARATGLQFSSYERNPNLSSAHQWNLNIQRQLGSDWLLEVAYSGSRGLHLLRQVDGNFSPPGPGAINAKRLFRSLEIPGTGITTSPLGGVFNHRYNGNSNYHALITKIERRFSNGFTLLSSYTFSKNLGDTCGGAAMGNASGCGFQDPRNLRAEKGIDNQDVPHRFVMSGLYDLPYGRGRRWGASSNAFVNAALGGWTIGTIVTASSGLPYSITVAGNPANTGNIAIVNRPDLIGDPRGGTRTIQQDFNIAAFQRNQPFTLGNLGRNTLRQRSLYNWDFSALKNWQLGDRLGLQFRFEAFQFTNTPRFGTPGIVLGNPGFGAITSANTPRNLQGGLKLIW